MHKDSECNCVRTFSQLLLCSTAQKGIWGQLWTMCVFHLPLWLKSNLIVDYNRCTFQWNAYLRAPNQQCSFQKNTDKNKRIINKKVLPVALLFPLCKRQLWAMWVPRHCVVMSGGNVTDKLKWWSHIITSSCPDQRDIWGSTTSSTGLGRTRSTSTHTHTPWHAVVIFTNNNIY